MSDIVIYQGDTGVVEVRLEGESVWLRQEQLAELFGRDRTVIGRHIRNVFAEGEQEQDSVCADFAHTAADGKTYQVAHFNLDVIISVGYRVKSPEGVRFRQWATQLLREHLTRGYTLNRNGRLLGRDGQPVINDIGLAALALLVAESDPAQKDTLIRLIMNMLAGAVIE
ncbi:MAG: putative DNA-binding protein in cluster with Type restriction-modification system [Moraxellaceae bacterium]|jgi:hypothetical protein|nr:putative DNA-binding protein in cluster with Type restriction-modification system [Moraxellaceae bacterium]